VIDNERIARLEVALTNLTVRVYRLQYSITAIGLMLGLKGDDVVEAAKRIEEIEGIPGL
jgi:hypothetical protein